MHSTLPPTHICPLVMGGGEERGMSMSHVNFKKYLCHMSLALILSCRPVLLSLMSLRVSPCSRCLKSCPNIIYSVDLKT